MLKGNLVSVLFMTVFLVLNEFLNVHPSLKLIIFVYIAKNDLGL